MEPELLEGKTGEEEVSENELRQYLKDNLDLKVKVRNDDGIIDVTVALLLAVRDETGVRVKFEEIASDRATD